MAKPLYVNERPVPYLAGQTAHDIRAIYKPAADVVVVNGMPLADPAAHALQPGDRLVLIERGVTDAPDELACQLFSRNTPAVTRAIQQKTVGLAGAGGLGSNLALALARLGVGRLIVADYDVVEPSNLNRQAFFLDQLGEAKTAATRANVARISPLCQVTTVNEPLTPTTIPTVFAQADVIAECLDRAETKRMLIETVLAHMNDVPVVAVSGIAGYGDANALYVRRRGRRLWMVGDAESTEAPGQGLLAPRVTQAAAMQANTVLRLLLGAEGNGSR